MEGINQDLISKHFLNPTNVLDGIRAGAFQGGGFLGRGPGVYLGDVWPYSICPNYTDDALLNSQEGQESISANASIYLQLGQINFSNFDGFVTLLNNNQVSSGTCIELDYERNLRFFHSQSCEVTVSSMDRYFRKTVTKYTFTGNGTGDLGPLKYLFSIKVTNQSDEPMDYLLSLGKGFGLPYGGLAYRTSDYVKNLIYDGDLLMTAENLPANITWLAMIWDGKTPFEVATIETGFTRPWIDFTPAFADGAPFENSPFDGQRVLTIYTQQFGIGNLPSYATQNQSNQFLNGNSVAALGVKPFSENFVPWFG